MRRLLFLASFLSLGVSDCNSLPYKSDIGLMSAVDANSFELKYHVNDLPCKDIQGKFGKCAYSIREEEDLNLKLYIPPGPGSVRIYVPNRDTLNIPFRDQEKPLEIKIQAIKKSEDGTVGISVILDEAKGAIQGLIFLTVTDREFVPLETPQIKSDGDEIEIIASAYSKWFGLNVGGERTILEKVNKISFDRDGKPVSVETYSESLRTSYNELAQ